MKRRYLRVSLGLVIFGLCLILGFWWAWPHWLEAEVKRRGAAALQTQFDDVTFGAVQVSQDTLIVKDLILSNPDAHFEFHQITMTFTLDLWSPGVTPHTVEVAGGTFRGSYQGVQDLRESLSRSTPLAKGSSDPEHPPSINVMDFKFHLDQGDYQTQGVMSSHGSLESPSLHLHEVLITENRPGSSPVSQISVRDVQAQPDPNQPFPLILAVEGLSAQISGAAINLQEVEGTINVMDPALHELQVALRGNTSAGQSWEFVGALDRIKDSAQGHFLAEHVRPDQLPGADHIPLIKDHGSISVDLQVSKDKNLVKVQGNASVMDLEILHEKLAKNKVTLSGDLYLNAQVNLETQELLLEEFTLQPRSSTNSELVSNVQVRAKARLLWTSDPRAREFELTMSMPSTPCQDVLEVMPPGLLPVLEEFTLTGTTTVNFKIGISMSKPEATILEGGLDLEACTPAKLPTIITNLRGPFTHVIRMKDGRIAQVPLVQGHPYYAPYAEIPPPMTAAVLTTEDGRFWSHHGYSSSAFYDSLKRNVQVGAFQRGASTLTMQMVKNVLLSQEKTISRKLQELFLTWVVESTLSKERILEIYLNVVEFGPGIYGVSHASQHYFGKHISQIASLEAAFLATLLPRPVARHDMWCRNALTPKHERYVRKIHERMLAKGRITQEEFVLGDSTGILFNRPAAPGDVSRCIAEGKRLSSGPFIQEALSGLLAGK